MRGAFLPVRRASEQRAGPGLVVTAELRGPGGGSEGIFPSRSRGDASDPKHRAGEAKQGAKARTGSQVPSLHPLTPERFSRALAPGAAVCTSVGLTPGAAVSPPCPEPCPGPENLGLRFLREVLKSSPIQRRSDRFQQRRGEGGPGPRPPHRLRWLGSVDCSPLLPNLQLRGREGSSLRPRLEGQQGELIALLPPVFCSQACLGKE